MGHIKQNLFYTIKSCKWKPVTSIITRYLKQNSPNGYRKYQLMRVLRAQTVMEAKEPEGAHTATTRHLVPNTVHPTKA